MKHNESSHAYKSNNYAKVLKIHLRREYVIKQNNDNNPLNNYCYSNNQDNTNNSFQSDNENNNFKPHKANKYDIPSSFRIFNQPLQCEPIKKNQNSIGNSYNQKSWNKIMNKTSKEKALLNSQIRISNSNSFKSQIFPDEKIRDKQEKRRVKETKNSVYSNTSQIYSLPGCIKRNPEEIKDDAVIPAKLTIGHLVKMHKEYNAGFTLIGEIEEIENKFPYEQRYGMPYFHRSQSQIFSQREDNKSYCNSKGCNYQSIYNQKSQIFNNDSSIYESTKGKKKFFDQGGLRSQITLE